MIAIDSENPIVRLCAEGMVLEQSRRTAEAKALFERAWSESHNDFEACIAAHFLARHQADPGRALAWNLEALERAEAVGDGRIDAFLPSLLLNLAYSHEVLGLTDEAWRYYRQANHRLGMLEPGPYAEVVRSGVSRGLDRLGNT
jgi:tetratricopeptide (TPR) repeat protein